MVIRIFNILLPSIALMSNEDAGIFGATIVVCLTYFIYQVIKSSTNKQVKKENKFAVDKRQIDLRIGELEMIHKKGIISKGELEIKRNEFVAQKIDLMVDYYLKMNTKYLGILEAYKKGFINEDQRNEKIRAIKSEIEGNVRKKEGVKGQTEL